MKLGCLWVLALVGCGGGQTPPQDTSTTGKTTTAPPTVASATPASSSSSTASTTHGNPCEAKVPGVELQRVGTWVPKWDEGAGCEWSKEGEFWGIKLRFFPGSLDTTTKLRNIDDLKKAAPMMLEIGTAVTKVIAAPKKTSKGWYAVVESNEGESQDFVYVQELATGKTLVCSATVQSAHGMGGVPVEDAIAACESIIFK